MRAVKGIAILAILFTHVTWATAQSPVPIDTVDAATRVSSDFPTGIEVTANIQRSFDTVANVDLLIAVAADQTLYLTAVSAADIRPVDGGIEVRAYLDMIALAIPAGVTMDAFWRITAPTAEIIDTAKVALTWQDDRFAWQASISELVTIHGYALSAAFSAEIAAAAAATVDALHDRYGMALDGTVDIWVYDSVTDFRGTLAANSREAVAGVSYPGFGVIHLVLAKGDAREIGRTVTHEVAHQVLASALGDIGTVPLWFDEGIATHAQSEGVDGYLPLAIYAVTNGKRFSLASLDGSFPYIAADASIAYAISWSAIAMIEDSYGPEAVANMIAAFAAGMPAADAVHAALGMTIAELDGQLNDWLLARSGS